MTPFQDALSGELKEAYITYFNSLNLRNPENGERLVIAPEGRSGSGYDYLMELLNESAAVYLKKLAAGKLPVDYSVGRKGRFKGTGRGGFDAGTCRAGRGVAKTGQDMQRGGAAFLGGYGGPHV